LRDFKLYLEDFKTKRGTKIAKMTDKEEFRTIHINKGQLIQTIEYPRNEKEGGYLVCELDFLIDRFKRSDIRREAKGIDNWKFTDFGLGFMYGVYFQNLWNAKNIGKRDKDRENYYKVLLIEREAESLQ